MSTFSDRVKLYFAKTGSKAKTIHGQVRAIREHKNSARIISNKMGEELGGQEVRTARKPTSSRDAMILRLRADSQFRNRSCRKFNKELVKLTCGRVGLSEYSRAKEIDQYLLEAGLVLFSRISLLSPSMEAVRQVGGYIKTRGQGSRVIGGCESGYTYDERTLRREAGLNWPVTDQYAGWKNIIRAVVVRQRESTIIFLGWQTKSGKKVEKELVLPASGVGKGYWGYGPALEGEVALPGQQDPYYHRYTLEGQFVGYAVCMDNNWEHSDTISGLAAELDHKRLVSQAKEKIKKLNSKDYRAIRLLARISTHKVGYNAARETGACKDGIKNWCAMRNITISDTVSVSALFSDSNLHARAMAKQIATNIWVSRN